MRPGDVVVDIGSGTGILAFFACQAGARRVYAVESGDVIEVARALAQQNGFEDRITFIHGVSRQIDIPEPADVAIVDVGGPFALQAGLLGSVMDARRRFLKVGGVTIPRALELFVVPAELPHLHAQEIDLWRQDFYGLNYSLVRTCAENCLSRTRVEERAFLARPTRFVSLDMGHLETIALRGEVTVLATRTGVLHGIGGWFVADLAAGVSITNGPGLQATHWRQIVFPVSGSHRVEAGDTINIAVSSYDGAEWAWQVEVARHGRVLVRKEHATLRSFPVSLERVRRLARG